MKSSIGKQSDVYSRNHAKQLLAILVLLGTVCGIFPSRTVSASKDGSGFVAASSGQASMRIANGVMPKSTHPATQKLWALDFDTCATSNGVVRCWGSGYSPVYGLPPLEWQIRNPTPVVIGPTLSNLTDLSVGASACGVSNGSVKCWGDSAYGIAGNGEQGFFRTPIQVSGLSSGVTSVHEDGSTACAVQNGSLLCWGWNKYDMYQTNLPQVVSGLESGVSLIVGHSIGSCVLLSGGVKCAGINIYGNLGNGNTRESIGKFVDVVGLPPGSGATALAVALQGTCAIVNGGVKCWGGGRDGRIGNSETGDSYVPVDVSGLGSGSGATDISTGSRGDIGGGSHTCAVVNSGVQCWGFNRSGQLGDGTTESSAVPVQVLGIGPGSGATDVEVGDSHTCALVRGDVFCWGSNERGQLGDGSGKSSSTPVGVRGLSATTTPKTAPAAVGKCLGNEFSLRPLTHRGFWVERQKTTINWTFQYHIVDDYLKITKWQIIPIHPQNKKKRGDKKIVHGNGCERSLTNEIDSYNPSSVRTVEVKRHRNGMVKDWSFNGSVPKTRDEVDRVALVGLNARGERVAFYVQSVLSGPRRGGTIMGKIENFKCRSSVILLPVAQYVYVVSHAGIKALDIAEVPAASKANLLLESFAIYQGVDKDGRVSGKVGFSFDGSEDDNDKLMQYGEIIFNEGFEKFATKKSTFANAKIINDTKLVLDVFIYLDDWNKAMEAIGTTVRKSSLELCDFWS